MRRKWKILGTALALLAALTAWAAWSWFPSAKGPAYSFVLDWGSPGSGPGEFREPIGIAVAGDEVFVSDAGNNRIQVFDLNGRFLRSFGHEGDDLGQLSRPMHMDVRDGKLYVAEYLNDRIQVFSLEGEPLAAIGRPGSGPGEFDAPGGVAVDTEGNLYVADFYNHRVQLLRPDGSFIRQWGTTGEKGLRAGRFNYPTDVALFPDGSLLVADAYNDRVQVFDPDGAFARKWGGPLALNVSGSAHGWFKVATGVTVDETGNVFVVDFYNHRVQRFTQEGRFLVSVGVKGISPRQSATRPAATQPATRPAVQPASSHHGGRFDRPTDVAVDDKGNLYIVDFGNNRIQKFAPVH